MRRASPSVGDGPTSSHRTSFCQRRNDLRLPAYLEADTGAIVMSFVICIVFCYFCHWHCLLLFLSFAQSFVIFVICTIFRYFCHLHCLLLFLSFALSYVIFVICIVFCYFCHLPSCILFLLRLLCLLLRVLSFDIVVACIVFCFCWRCYLYCCSDRRGCLHCCWLHCCCCLHCCCLHC